MVRLMVLSLLLPFMMFCDSNPTDSEDCSKLSDPDAAIELVYPAGGETFTVGSSVNVRWKVATELITSGMVTVEVSVNGISGPWKQLISGGVSVPSDVKVACMDTVWTIGGEWGMIDYTASQTVLLKVRDYNDNNIKDVSSSITINQ